MIVSDMSPPGSGRKMREIAFSPMNVASVATIGCRPSGSTRIQFNTPTAKAASTAMVHPAGLVCDRSAVRQVE